MSNSDYTQGDEWIKSNDLHPDLETEKEHCLDLQATQQMRDKL